MAVNDYPGAPLKVGDSGGDVTTMQYYLNGIRTGMYLAAEPLRVDGIFGSATESAVKRYQTLKGFASDGVIGPITWNGVVADYSALPEEIRDRYPGAALTFGSSGAPVDKMQAMLNAAAEVYTSINTLTRDGIFGQNSANAVRRFQRQFNLSADGVIGQNTWNEIVNVNNLLRARTPPAVDPPYPGQPLGVGSRGDDVRFVQSYMTRVGGFHSAGFPAAAVDGAFGSSTRALVTAFQRYYNLNADGVVGPNTWNAMVFQYNATL